MTDATQEQPYCPDCLAPIGKGGMTEKQVEGALKKHRGSEQCLKNQEYAQRILALRGQAEGDEPPEERPAPTSAKELASVRQNLGLQDEEVVVFESPMSENKVWLRHPAKQYAGDGRLIHRDPGIQMKFRNHRFVTSDPEVIRLARKSPSNVVQLEKRGIEGKALELHKSRFYEVEAPASAEKTA